MLEEQAEEREALCAIYDGDGSFQQVDTTSFQYLIGDRNQKQRFALRVYWPSDYPNCIPHISLELSQNNHIPQDVKLVILDKLKDLAEENIGVAMTFSLFEFCRDNLEELLPLDSLPAVKEKKVQLTKAQKRKIICPEDERPRGWNWVDVIRHLSKTGAQEP